MEFGRLEDHELDAQEIIFPEIMPLGKSVSQTTLHIGIPLWGSDHLRGTLYPKDTKKVDYLHTYASALDVLELNTTYHSIHDVELIESWREAVSHNPNFRFLPKLPRIISHEGRLDHHFDLLSRFTESIRAFKEHLGMSFLQLPPSFTPSRIHELVGFLDLWPQELKLGIELRHLIWFKNQEVRDTIRRLLTERNISWVITDTPGLPDVRHQNFTSNEVLIRFVSTGLHPKDEEKLQRWSESFKRYADAGIKDIYFFIHERDEWLWREGLEKFFAMNSDLVIKPLLPLKEGETQLDLI